jgi:hypothetical protein
MSEFFLSSSLIMVYYYFKEPVNKFDLRIIGTSNEKLGFAFIYKKL